MTKHEGRERVDSGDIEYLPAPDGGFGGGKITLRAKMLGGLASAAIALISGAVTAIATQAYARGEAKQVLVSIQKDLAETKAIAEAATRLAAAAPKAEEVTEARRVSRRNERILMLLCIDRFGSTKCRREAAEEKR